MLRRSLTQKPTNTKILFLDVAKKPELMYLTQGTLVISEMRMGPGVKRKKLKARGQDNAFEMIEIDSLSFYFF